MPFSVIITTFNEADNIGRCIASIGGESDDILVVDSFSTDDTVAIAQRYPHVRVVQRAYSGPADQKNWAIPQARYPWVLLLDADEAVPSRLLAEMKTLLQTPDTLLDLYWIPRQNHFLGQRLRFSGWQGDRVVRFFRRDKARYNDRQVHEEIITHGATVGTLSAHLEHYTFRNLDHYLDKTRRYARWSAQDHAARTPRVGAYHLIAKPLFRFFKHYVLQQGFRDGKVGFIVSTIMAWGVFLRYVYLWEMRRG